MIGFVAGVAVCGFLFCACNYVATRPLRRFRAQRWADEQAGNDPASTFLAAYSSFLAKQSCRSRVAQGVFDDVSELRNESEGLRRTIDDWDKNSMGLVAESVT